MDTMDCDVFLDGYSEYRDGLLPGAEHGAFAAHLAECASCARYDRVIGKGVRMLRDEPELEVSEDFMARLQHRIYHIDEEKRSSAGRRARGVAAGGTLAAAAALAGMTLMNSGDDAAAMPGVAVQSGSAVAASMVAAEAENAATGLGARLEQVGVEVYPMPYRDVLYSTASLTGGNGHTAGASRSRGE
jgi:anti-sigma factor RsiW